MYTYLNDDEREGLLVERKRKGEDDDEWCYNCGEEGHLGDVGEFNL